MKLEQLLFFLCFIIIVFSIGITTVTMYKNKESGADRGGRWKTGAAVEKIEDKKSGIDWRVKKIREKTAANLQKYHSEMEKKKPEFRTEKKSIYLFICFLLLLLWEKKNCILSTIFTATDNNSNCDGNDDNGNSNSNSNSGGSGGGGGDSDCGDLTDGDNYNQIWTNITNWELKR